MNLQFLIAFSQIKKYLTKTLEISKIKFKLLQKVQNKLIS
jgi:hypothetical protein